MGIGAGIELSSRDGLRLSLCHMPDSPRDQVLGLVVSRSEIIEGLLRKEMPAIRGGRKGIAADRSYGGGRMFMGECGVTGIPEESCIHKGVGHEGVESNSCSRDLL